MNQHGVPSSSGSQKAGVGPKPEAKPKPRNRRQAPLATTQPAQQPQPTPITPAKPVSKPRPPPDKQAWLRQNTGAQISTIGRDDLRPDPSPVTSATGFEVLCSYNWQECLMPSIYVPGAPPRWTPQSLPMTLREDEGGRYIDQNAHRVPRYPFEPLFQAMNVMKPEYDLDKVDMVANRNSMRKLLNFVSGKVDEPFRIDLDMVRDTLFVTRRERWTRENTRKGWKPMNLGFGHNFEKAFTVHQEELRGSSSHHRVARYMIGDLDCVVRYEVDAWIADAEDEEGEKGKSKLASAEKKVEKEDDDSLLESLEKLSLGKETLPTPTQTQPATKTKPPSKSQGTGPSRSTLAVPRGSAIPSNKLAELKTKAKDPRRSDLIPQLWFGRIPYLAIGLHEKGKFHNVSVTSTEDDFQVFETTQQDNLRKIVHVIKLLKKVTAESRDQACVIVCDHKVKPLRLMVYSVTNKKKVLPQELVKRYWGGTKG